MGACLQSGSISLNGHRLAAHPSTSVPQPDLSFSEARTRGNSWQLELQSRPIVLRRRSPPSRRDRGAIGLLEKNFEATPPTFKNNPPKPQLRGNKMATQQKRSKKPPGIWVPAPK